MASLSPGMMIKIRVAGNHTLTMGCILRRKWGQNQVSNESKCWIHHYLRRRFSWLIMFKQINYSLLWYFKYNIFWYPSSWCLLLFGEPKWSQPECCGTAIQEQMGWLMSLSQNPFWHFQPYRPSAEALEKTRKTRVSESVNAWNLAIIMHEAWELCNIKYM